jgi:putative methyltransferase
MIKRDLEIARYFVETKLKYGFPEKLRVCYGKNAEDNIYKIGKLLHKYDMEKGITMSPQSRCAEALSNVGRKNIKLSVYNNLQKKYNQDNIPIYTELILGLPGETYQSFVKGIEEIMQAGIKNQLFGYFCQVYPNTELDDKEYRKKFKISTVTIPLNEIHAAVRPEGLIPEYEEIVVSTLSMPVEDWKRAAVISWIMQLFHGLKLGFYILIYLVDRYSVKYTDFFEYIGLLKIKSEKIKMLKDEVIFFYKSLDSILQGGPRGWVMPDFGNIYWEIEEASYLNISHDKENFYNDMYVVAKEYLDRIGVAFIDDELKEVVEYQKARVPDYKPLTKREYYFKHNLPEYFETYFLRDRESLANVPQVMILTDAKDYNGDKKAFAREIVVYGRKSDKMLYPVRWFNADKKSQKFLEVNL